MSQQDLLVSGGGVGGTTPQDDDDDEVDAADLIEQERDPTDTVSVEEPSLSGADFEDVDARVYIDGDRYGIVAYKEYSDIGPMASFGKCEVIPMGHNNSPDYNSHFEAEVKVSADEEAQDIPEREEMFNKWVTLFTGHVNNFRHKGYDRWHIEFSNFESDLLEDVTVEYTDDVIYLDEIVEEIVSKVSGEPADIRLDNIELDTDVSGVDRVVGVTRPDGGFSEAPDFSTEESLRLAQRLGQQFKGVIDGPLGMGGQAALGMNHAGMTGTQPVTTKMKFDRENERAADLLDELATFADAKWWVDSENVFHFGKPNTEDSDGLLDPQERKLLFVTDNEAGWLTPPYNSVVVIADGVVAEEGWGSDHLESNENPVVTARIPSPGADEDEIIPNEVEEPIFTYKNKDIKTPKQAKNVAISLAEDLAEQLEGGSITVVGRPDIQLLDVILMPEHLTPSGDEYAYSVGGVIHELNPQGGFTTTIEIFHMLGLDNEVSEVRGALEFQRDDGESQSPDDTVTYRGTEMTRKQRDLLRGTGDTL